MGAVELAGRLGPAADGAEPHHDSRFTFGACHAYVPTDNSNKTISQRFVTVTLLYIRIESNQHIDFWSILW
jgi:hypothetical protein